ncbi:MAG: alpha/beta fold hydrolase [Hyphomicrobiaceae bacterium]
MPALPELDSKHLGPGVRARFVDGVNGLRMHVLEAGYESKGRPLLLLLHGFPELAYSWRKVMAPLAEAGFHVVAPDQRGYGRTSGSDNAYDQDLRPFYMLSLARDAVALSLALGYRKVAAVIGHDFGAAVTSWCALTRPDMFERCAIMSAPFGGPPSLPFGTAIGDAHVAGLDRAGLDIDEALGKLPRPRKHYQRYYTTREANDDMWRCDEGVGAFLRAYFHHKSADWAGNKPHPLKEWSAACLAEMPTYYVMDRAETMAETVRPHMPSAAAVAANTWLSPAEMAIYAEEYGRTGFQGGLNWYRARYEPHLNAELSLFSGKVIDVPSLFIAGKSDWGIHQVPGALETMQTRAFSKMTGVHQVDGAGHWVQQEQPEKVIALLRAFLA